MDERDEILDLIKNNRNHYTIMVKKDVRLNDWILKNTLIDDTTNKWAAVIRSAVYQESNICEHGNVRKFTSITEGFKSGCGRASDCQCVRASVSDKMTKIQQSRSKEEHDKIHANQVQTMLKEYGVINAGQLQQTKIAHKNFFNDEDNVKAFVEKGKATKLEKYGDNAEYWVNKTGNENYRILYDKEKLAEYTTKYSAKQLSEMFDIPTYTISRCAKKIGAPLPLKIRIKYNPLDN